MIRRTTAKFYAYLGARPDRQSEILQLLAEGMSMKEVANEIHIKPGTVAFHKYRMMETLNVKTNAELLEYAIKRRMKPA
jgi:DNA-binding NarL/FixJ family response regulator